LVEALVAPNCRFMVGVQWHPEMMFRRHPEQLAPFRQLVAAAQAARLSATAV
jgi:gamma-glutamyl-gamma-aminobutyrate hydrolase PuuD